MGLRYPSDRTVLQKPYRGFSRLDFDLPPNPSIDHLVPVILKYPRREESLEEESEPRSDRPALYRIVDMNLGESTSYALR
jgi:hypothetical protein